MSIIQAVKTIIIEAVWPWIKSSVWPFIKEHLKEILIFLAAEIRERIKEHAKRKMDERVKEAEEKAMAAEQAAHISENLQETQKQEVLAKVWREVAENLRKDNEELQAKINEIVAKSERDSIQKVDSEAISLEFNETSALVKIGSNERSLPPPTI